jgi:hypothetical protein
MSRQPRAVLASKLWKSKFLAPNGDLSDDGRLMLADLAKFCHASLPAVQKDMAGRIDALAVQQIIGRQEVYLRIAAMLSVNDIQTQRLAHMNWPGDEPEETGI